MLIFKKEFDLSIDLVAIDDYLQRFSVYHWINEAYNLVILSRLYTETPDILKMFRVFSLVVWLLIIQSTIFITKFLVIYKRVKGST